MSSRPHPSSSRYSSRVSFGFLVWMVLFAIITSAGGVTYAVLKNMQVAVRTDINKLHRETAVCQMNANQYRARTNDQMNRWTMRSRLQNDHSALREIEPGQIEMARSARRMAAAYTR